MLVHSYCDTWIRDKDGIIIVTRTITSPPAAADIVLSFDVAGFESLFKAVQTHGDDTERDSG
jgi:hypothetical protein